MGDILYLRKAIRKLKSVGSLAIKFPSLDRGAQEIAIWAHFGAGDIMTKKGSRAKIGICS